MSGTIFHEGELYVQRITGEDLTAQRNCSMVQEVLNTGMEMYIKDISTFFVSSKDSSGNLWASIISGKKAFLTISNHTNLILDTNMLLSDPGDVFWKNITLDTNIGMLFIDLQTRRRLRINGKTTVAGNIINIAIEQCFPNCPKYIQRRQILSSASNNAGLGESLIEWIKNADTCFVASASSKSEMDVSHRGGHSGFILFESENVLIVPDYTGNSMFNTLGNFFVNPAAGMLFIDFSNGNTLQLSGTAELHLQNDENPFVDKATRYWKFYISRKILKNSVPGFSANFIDFSPFNP
ncbi:pyridoxamine 5'-phosphate oxidase family protein [Pedobacter jamesrossensis]|uniref:Pyridoxamine 5'-phosphate oxidase family protein n=1 Tax=Pedobacter jamesrossensis TaxID=1908238 RepID=A0ABV8NLR7_9SPHI